MRSLFVFPDALAAEPLLASYSISAERVCETAKVQRLAELGPRNTRVVRAEDLLDEQRRHLILRDALEHGVVILFVGAETELEQDKLTTALPTIAMRIDEPQQATERSLYGINVTQLLQFCLAQDENMGATLSGLSTRRMLRDALDSIPASVPLNRVSWVQRALQHPSFPVYLVVFVYSSLRVLPVSLVSQFHGSLAMLWLIDVITAVPYTWGVLAMLFAPQRRVRVLATAVTIITFVGPYVYFWLNGRGYPPYVPIVIAVLTVSSVLLETNRYLQEQRLRRSYRSVSPTAPAPVAAGSLAAL